VALARKALEKNGPDALETWGQFLLYYGCRAENEDFLYKEEWPEYVQELKGKFVLRTAFSRSGPRKPDGSKIYVQDLMWEDRENIAKIVGEQKGNVYICGDARSMSKAVEDVLARILGEAGGQGIAEGRLEVKRLKERSRLLLDVWS
jgi:NADPH-ferrihemoprotein reductase